MSSTRNSMEQDRNDSAKLNAIVFDFDGTLAELHLDFAQMKQQLAAAVRGYLPGSAAPSATPALEWLESSVAQVHASNPALAVELRERAEALIAALELDAARRGRLFAFSRPLLRELRARGVQTAIITRNCERAVRMVFPDLDDYCAEFLAREHVHRVKPNPRHLLQALGGLSADPETALMVGDHPLDIETGRRAGILSAGVWSGNASRTELLRSGARWTARNCHELIEKLKAEGRI